MCQGDNPEKNCDRRATENLTYCWGPQGPLIFPNLMEVDEKTTILSKDVSPAGLNIPPRDLQLAIANWECLNKKRYMTTNSFDLNAQAFAQIKAIRIEAESPANVVWRCQ